MNILSIKAGHDGQVCSIEDGTLVFSYEAEKNSGRRYAEASAYDLLNAMGSVQEKPEAIAVSGWSVGTSPLGYPIGAGYLGLTVPRITQWNFLGQKILLGASSHERSHLLCSYAMSPFPQGEPCYALIWEGFLGAIYKIDAGLNISKLVEVMRAPGDRYAFAHAIVDPTFSLPAGKIRLSDAGKVMALAGFYRTVNPSPEEAELLIRVLNSSETVDCLDKGKYARLQLYNSGIASESSKRLARLVSDGIFGRFFEALDKNCKEKYPLLIGGGCGLNCEWNSRLLHSGKFESVFIPPCCNDTGSAIGTAVDIQWILTGKAKLIWNVYAGQDFEDDLSAIRSAGTVDFRLVGGGLPIIAEALRNGKIIAWVSGRCEIGPRALGNRSILAAPFLSDTRDRLNRIKQRESFRPIAPVCMEEDLMRCFEMGGTSPYMLQFAKVTAPSLGAITHVDGTARPQSVSRAQNALLYDLLFEFRKISGYGVLCNTSLNFKGCGFINKSTDLFRFAREFGLDGVVIEGALFLRAQSTIEIGHA